VDLENARTFELFLEIFGTLPRAGPGSTADTLRALAMVPTDNVTSVLDLGCGPGAQTLVLGEALPEATILAIDLTPSLVTRARRRVGLAGLNDRVRVEVGDMMNTDVPEGSQDLIWCEGAIYFAGVENGLRTWRPLLAPQGSVGFTEPIWIHPSPPEALVSWWRGEYPAITDEAGVRAMVAAAGFEIVGFFVLPADSWWNEYYEPMTGRVAEFRENHPNDPLATEIADVAEKEIKTFKKYSEYYSYGFFVVQPAAH
jgi:trans-aconitate methyltransferase